MLLWPEVARERLSEGPEGAPALLGGVCGEAAELLRDYAKCGSLEEVPERQRNSLLVCLAYLQGKIMPGAGPVRARSFWRDPDCTAQQQLSHRVNKPNQQSINSSKHERSRQPSPHFM